MQILENGVLRDATPEELAQAEIDAQSAAVYHVEKMRVERDRLLTATDWTQAKDVPDAVSSKWAPYRQALRDVPQQAGFPDNIQWPVKPE